MTILVFPSATEAAADFVKDARYWGRSTVGSSSVENDPNAGLFDAWERLPFIGDPTFFDALGDLVRRRAITAFYTPHAPTFHFMERQLRHHLPNLQLMGIGPFEQRMRDVVEATGTAEAAMTAISDRTGTALRLPAAFVAGLLRQAETIHGECSREKMLAICATVPLAPPGDIVEIGSLFGKSSYVLNRVGAYCNIGATLCVDPWLLDTSIQRDAPDYIQSASESWDWNVIYCGFLQSMLSCSSPPFNYLRATSAKACRQYRKNSTVSSPEFGVTNFHGRIAVLHLDGNHDEAAVAEDFKLWSPFVLPGGWIIFDDYHWPHGSGPRVVADRAIADLGGRVTRSFVAGGAMFVRI